MFEIALKTGLYRLRISFARFDVTANDVAAERIRVAIAK